MRSVALGGSSSRFPISAAPRERSAMLTSLLRPTRRRLAPSPAFASAPASASSSGRQNRRPSLDAINNATKWTVSAATAGVLLLGNGGDPSTTRFAVVGAVAAALSTKLLKKLVNESRPPEARKRDPGMPSSHAQSLAFLSTSAARAILVSSLKKGGGQELTFSFLPLPPVATAALVLATAALLATLRVVLGYHTWPQVVAGGALGCVLALSWGELGARFVVPLCCSGSSSSRNTAVLAGATGLAVAIFAFVTVRSWWRERGAEGGDERRGKEV